MLPLTPMRIFTEARLDEGEHAAEEVLAEVRERRRPKRLARWWRLQGFLLKPPKRVTATATTMAMASTTQEAGPQTGWRHGGGRGAFAWAANER